MSLDNQKIEDRIKHFREDYWPIEDFNSWYGLNLDDSFTEQIFERLKKFQGAFKEPTRSGVSRYSHWHFELELQRLDLVPVRQAAAELAMNVETFQNVIKKFNEIGDVTFVPAVPEATHTIVRRTFLRDFHKGFEKLIKKSFPDHPTYIDLLHREIRSVLEVDFEILMDSADIASGSKYRRPSFRIDCLTDDPVGLGNEVFVETYKPVALAPDFCSILTYARYQDVLSKYILGSRPEEEDLVRFKVK